MTPGAAVKKVLIIDDDSRNIFALTAVLKAKGYPCEAVPSTSEGFVKLEQSGDSTGIILLDMMMPEMDGYETLQKIRESRFSTLPVIAVTAQAMAGDRERCLAAGANDYLPKPVDVDKLLLLLQKYLT